MAGFFGGLIGSTGAPAFTATGGTFTVDANGHRHHIFRTSGTLTVSGGEKTLHALTQNGGFSGTSTNASGVGGNSGEFVYRAVNYTSGNITITVGGAAATSSFSGTGIQVTTSSTTPARAGQSGILLSNLAGGIFTSVANLTTNSGGGGGNRGAAGFASGGGAGGHPTNGAVGQPGASNTGGGGGGGGYSSATCFNGDFFFECGSSTAAGAGGSGYVVISYAL